MTQRITFPNSTIHPRSMPELRAALLDQAVPGGIWVQAEFEKLLVELTGSETGKQRQPDGTYIIAGPNGYTADEMPNLITQASGHADNNIRWYRETLPMSQLIHVNEQMTDFIVAAAECRAHRLEAAPSRCTGTGWTRCVRQARVRH